MSTKPCGRQVVRGTGPQVEDKGLGRCSYPRMAGKQQCVWHWLLKQDAETQATIAKSRRDGAVIFAIARDRVPRDEWPDGERWCAGCQSFVPLFYVTGSRCRSCASTASHRAMVQKTYGLEPGEYDALFALQGGRCFICQRKSPSRRLAVDHDHVTGAVRGLLCPDPDRGCNHAILGPLEASPGGALAAAKRMVLYLEKTPYERIKDGEGLSWAQYVAQQAARASLPAEERLSGTPGAPPPF